MLVSAWIDWTGMTCLSVQLAKSSEAFRAIALIFRSICDWVLCACRRRSSTSAFAMCICLSAESARVLSESMDFVTSSRWWAVNAPRWSCRSFWTSDALQPAPANGQVVGFIPHIGSCFESSERLMFFVLQL